MDDEVKVHLLPLFFRESSTSGSLARVLACQLINAVGAGFDAAPKEVQAAYSDNPINELKSMGDHALVLLDTLRNKCPTREFRAAPTTSLCVLENLLQDL